MIPSDRPGQRVKHHARDQFQRWSRTYDRSWLNEAVFFPAIRACQEEITRWRQRRRRDQYCVLDVGCGTGTLLTILSGDPAARTLAGLDYSPNMIRGVVKKTRELGLEGRIQAVCGDAERLPFADGVFDVLTCCNSFHHYPNQAAAIAGFARVLRPGGILILIDGFRDNVVGWVIYDVVVERIEKHVHHASWTECREMIMSGGFADLHQRKLNVLAPLLVNVAGR